MPALPSIFRRRPRSADKSPDQRTLWQLVRPFMGGQKRRLILISVAAVFGGLAEAATLVLVARIAFALASNSDTVSVDVGPVKAHISVPTLVGISLVLLVIRVALQVFQARLGAHLGASVLQRTRRRVLRQYLAADWNLQSQQRDGRLQDLMTTFVNQAAGAVATISLGAVALFNLLAFVGTALFVNALASLFIAILAFLLALALRPLRAAVRRRADRQARADLEFGTGVTEFTQSLQEVRIYGVGREVSERIDAINDRAAYLNARRYTLANTIPALYQGVALMLIVAALGLAYAVNFSDLASIGAVVLIMLRSLSYGQGLQGCVQSLQEAAPYLESLLDEEARYAQAVVTQGHVHVEELNELRFDDVTFAYREGEPVIRDMSFAIPRGEVVGVVGPSGAGKSTLVQLLLRLREPTAGRVLANGIDAATIDIDDWYQRVTFVPQETRLFAGTVRENITFYRTGIDDAAVERAARSAHIHDDIVAWPQGYDTPVGERGSQVSGGQRQRICIARALVDDPDVVVFDEPTSALDVRSESLMRDTMAALAPEKTVVVIAHRISTLTICHRIMVVFDGEMQGFDTPSALEESNPFYQEALRISGMR